MRPKTKKKSLTHNKPDGKKPVPRPAAARAASDENHSGEIIVLRESKNMKLTIIPGANIDLYYANAMAAKASIPNLWLNNEPLFLAIYTGNIAKIEQARREMTITSEVREFLIACLLSQEQAMKRQYNWEIQNRFEVIKSLVKQGFQPNYALLSSSFPNLQDIEAMLAGGTDINLNLFGHSMLHAAVMIDPFQGYQGINFLIDRGIDPNISEVAHGFGTALHVCLAHEEFDDSTAYAKAKHLIPRLANTSYEWDIRDGQGKTVLMIAAKMRATEIIQLLFQQVKEHHTINLDVNARDKQGRTAVHFCSALGNLTAVALLLEHGASIDIRDKQGLTAREYTRFDREAITLLLAEIHINAERDEYALHNCLMDPMRQPIWPKDTKGYDADDHLFACQDNAWLFPSLLERFATSDCEYDQRYMRMQFKFSGKSLLDACIAGQSKVQNLLESHIKRIKDLAAKSSSQPLHSPRIIPLEVSQQKKPPVVEELADENSLQAFEQLSMEYDAGRPGQKPGIRSAKTGRQSILSAPLAHSLSSFPLSSSPLYGRNVRRIRQDRTIPGNKDKVNDIIKGLERLLREALQKKGVLTDDDVNHFDKFAAQRLKKYYPVDSNLANVVESMRKRVIAEYNSPACHGL